MSSRGFLDHLLGQVQQTLQRSGLGERTPEGGNQLSGMGKGVLAGSALGLLLGNRSMRRLAGVGGLGALGVLSYRAYNDWKQQSVGGAQVQPLATVAALPAPDEHEARAVLRALVGAAKADGHIDERERALIQQGLQPLADGEDMAVWLEQELARPLDPAEIAAAADTPERAAELYLASRLVIDEPSFMERSYLDELARQLRLSPELREHLDRQAAGAARET